MCMCTCMCRVLCVCVESVCGVCAGSVWDVRCVFWCCGVNVVLWCCVFCCFCVVWCGLACGKPLRLCVQNASVCAFKTPPCVPGKRPHVTHFCNHVGRDGMASDAGKCRNPVRKKQLRKIARKARREFDAGRGALSE